MYSPDEKLGRESKDLAPAQVLGNHEMVDRALEKLVSSGNAIVN